MSIRRFIAFAERDYNKKKKDQIIDLQRSNAKINKKLLFWNCTKYLYVLGSKITISVKLSAVVLGHQNFVKPKAAEEDVRLKTMELLYLLVRELRSAEQWWNFFRRLTERFIFSPTSQDEFDSITLLGYFFRFET